MKSPTIPSRSLPNRALLACSMSIGIVSSGWLAQTRAESVDSELLLLVDVTRGALNNNEFSDLMAGYAAAFSSTEVLDSIQSGASGRIAVSLMYFGNANSQQVGIPWMMIENSTQALEFASLLQSAPRPFYIGLPNVASALATASSSFGTETGGASNGFESAVQIIEVAEARRPLFLTADAAATGSASALASGVDVINSLALGNQADVIDNFYTANVIGSTLQGVAASSSTAPLNNSLGTTLAGMLTESVNTGAATSITAVPEPGPVLPLLTGALLILGRRRR